MIEPVTASLVTPEGTPLTSPEDTPVDEPHHAQLPSPVGYRILVALPEVSERTDSGNIIKAEEARQIEEVATIVGLVLRLGPDAYMNKERFPGGPWCEEGDFVIFKAFTGTRIEIHGKEFRLINDDTVQAVVDDPRGIRRV